MNLHEATANIDYVLSQSPVSRELHMKAQISLNHLHVIAKKYHELVEEKEKAEPEKEDGSVKNVSKLKPKTKK